MGGGGAHIIFFFFFFFGGGGGHICAFLLGGHGPPPVPPPIPTALNNNPTVIYTARVERMLISNGCQKEMCGCIKTVHVHGKRFIENNYLIYD